jgi:hypothetical protein
MRKADDSQTGDVMTNKYNSVATEFKATITEALIFGEKKRATVRLVVTVEDESRQEFSTALTRAILHGEKDLADKFDENVVKVRFDLY